MKLFINCLFISTLSTILISCGGGSSNSDEIKQINIDSSSQNTQADTEDTKKIIEEFPTFENAKFDEAIYN